MKINKMFAAILAGLFWSQSSHAFKAEISEKDTVTVSESERNYSFKFPSEIKDYKVKSVLNPLTKGESALIVLVKCNDNESGTDKWYFQFCGFFGSSISAVELGVSPPPRSKISEIRYLYGDTFGFKLTYQSDDGTANDWYYVTSCPTRKGKDTVGAFLHPQAQKMIEEYEKE